MKTVKPGIRLKPNGKYVATKSIDGKRHYSEHSTLREAVIWKNNFHPLANREAEPVRIATTIPVQSNGLDYSINFREVVERYKSGRMKNCSIGRQYKKSKRMDRFLPPLYSVRMCEMKPEIITRLIEDAKLAAQDTFGRCSFSEEIKDLASIFNWYKDEVDFTFNSPVTKYHRKVGQIKEIERRQKFLSEKQLISFVNHLSEPFQSMVIIQYCMALRIGEVAAINTGTVDFDSKTIHITDVITWMKNKPKHQKGTKTGEDSAFPMNDEVYWRLKELEKNRPRGCKFFFHHKGGPMRYDIILKAYNEGLKNAKLDGFSGTHLIRHTMGTITRRKSGLDAAQAVLRHTTSRMAEHYARLDVNEKASNVVIEAGNIFRSRATVATSERESVESSVI